MAETIVQTPEGPKTVAQFYGVQEIPRPISNVTQVAAPVEKSIDEQAAAAGLIAEPETPELIAEDPLDLWDDETLKKDKDFNPILYFNEHGEGAMDPVKLDRLANIFKAKAEQGVSAGDVGDFFKKLGKGAIAAVWEIPRGLAVTAERAIVGPIAGAVGEFIPGETGKAVQEFAQRQMGELAAGVEAEATGLSEMARTGAQKLLTKAPATTEEAKRLLIDWAARTQQVEKASMGKGALAEDAGVELDPEAVQNVAAGGPLSLVAFGSAFKLVNAAGKTILKAPTRLAAFRAVQDLRRATAAETAAGQALKAGPRTAGLEAATESAIAERQAAEAAVRETPGAQAVNVLGQAAERVGAAVEAPKVVGTAAQAAGLTAEAAGWTAKLGSRALRATRPLGIPVGSLFGVPLAGIAEGISAAGKGLRAAGAAIKAEAPEVAARRAQDIINASTDVLKSAATGTAIDYGFALGTAKTDEEAREMPSVAGAIGTLAGGARGARRVLAGELIRPKGVPIKKISSPAYGENEILDSAHETGMERSSPEAQNQVNAVREIARKLGGRVYVMPDEATFKQVLDDLWKRQNNADVPPEVSQAHANWAAQNGMFSTSILGPDGKPQSIAFVRDPAALAHEGIGHMIDRVLPEDVNAALDRQTREIISPENWEAAGKYYAERLTGKPVADWRQTLKEAGIDLDPDTYLAREVRAENMDVAFRNRGEAFATSPGLYRWIVQTLGRVAEQAGVNLGEVSPELALPVSIETMARGEKAARGILENEAQQNLIQARDERLRETISPTEPVSPPAETPSQEAPKTLPGPGILPDVQKAKDWIDANPTKVPTPEAGAAAKVVADAIPAGEAVRVTYWAAKGTPAGEVTSLRPERRAEIEAQRQAANEDRQLVEHEFTPYRVEVRSTGPQFVGWSRDILNSNVAKFSEWAKKVEDKSRIPYETDANGLTENGLAQLREDARVYQENQANGYTGAGEKIVVPPEAEKLGAFKPEEKGEPLPIPQERADVINYLFNTKIPESAGRLAPLHLAGQEVSAATKPGRVEIPIRRRGEYSEATLRKAGITTPKGVREINPFRQWVESQPGEAPSLVEVSQRLNLSRIEEAQSAGPGAEPVKGNVLTQAAGFQPKQLDMASLPNATPEEWKAFTDSYQGRFGKGLTGWAFDLGAAAKTPEDLQAFRSAHEVLSAAGREAMKNGQFNEAMSFMTRSQAAREAYEAATGRTLDGTKEAGAPFIREHYDPNYQPPMAPKALGEAAQPRRLGEDEAKKILALHNKSGGSTFSLVAGKNKAGTKGFAVAVYPERSKIIEGKPTEQILKDYITENSDLLFDAENENSMGTWENEGKTYLDVVRIETSRGKAIDLAKQNNQKAIFDLKTSREIPTGGTGEVPKSTPTSAASQLPLASGTRSLEFTGGSVSGIKKSWILPDGTPIQTNGEWHHEWLANNPEIAKRYNLDVPDFEGSDAGSVREDAMKKGFARVNYTTRNGTLTVEARAKDWNKIKPTVEDMVDANIDQIDNMTVTLFDDNVAKVVDSDSQRLFEFSNKEKMENLPLITKSEVRGESFQPKPEKYPNFVKPKDLTAETRKSYWLSPKGNFFDAGRYHLQWAIDNLDVMSMEAAYSKGWRRVTASIDHDIFSEGGELNKNQKAALEDFAFSANLPVRDGKTEKILLESTAALGGESFQPKPEKATRMTRSEKIKAFPEAVIRPFGETIASEIEKSPLAKQAGNRDAALDAFADKLVAFAEEWKDHPSFKAGLKWYSDFTPMIHEQFGKDAPIFAELLAATSPQTDPKTNFRYAVEALKRWKEGHFDTIIEKYQEGLKKLADGTLKEEYAQDFLEGKVKNPPQKPNNGTYLAHYMLKQNLVPLREGGKRFGLHSVPVLKVLARRWYDEAGPKTKNFIQNLLGTGREATIDLWADRTMRRMGYEGFKERWRIMPENTRGPHDKDFKFSQEAFRRAADKMGLQPDDLQAALWFAEKQLWADKGWSGKLDLGDFRTYMKEYSEQQKSKVDIEPRGQ